MIKYFLAASLFVNVYFQFRSEAMWYIMRDLNKCTGFSYTETYILKIPYNFECH